MNKSVITKEMFHKLKFFFCFFLSRNKYETKMTSSLWNVSPLFFLPDFS